MQKLARSKGILSRAALMPLLRAGFCTLPKETALLRAGFCILENAVNPQQFPLSFTRKRVIIMINQIRGSTI
jgi:hypothetical protein